MTKLLLIQPASVSACEGIPLGLAYLAAAIKQTGNEVKIIHCAGVYSNYSNENILEIAKKYNPDAIGISVNSIDAQRVYQLVLLIKALGKPLISGGPHASTIPVELLEKGFDIVFIGESEETIKDYLYFLGGRKNLKDIKGIAYLESGKVHYTEKRELISDLDTIPFPDKSCFDKADIYRCNSEAENAFSTVITSRGCMSKCTFCSRSVFGNLYRLRTAKNIIAEIISLKKEYGIKTIYFIDDTINVNHKRLIEMCNLLKQEGIVWKCNARLDFMTKEILKCMKDSGCVYIDYGIESGDINILGLIKKGFTPEKAKEVIKWTHNAGIQLTLNFMFGFPFETKESIEKSLQFIEHMEPYYDDLMKGGIIIPYPDTELYNKYCDEYNFRNWWFEPEDYIEDVYNKRKNPLFKRIGFNDNALNGKRSFFNYNKLQKQHLKKAIKRINRVLIRKKAAKLNATSYTFLNLPIEYGLICLFNLSKLIYAFSPNIESKIMGSSYNRFRKSRSYNKIFCKKRLW